MPPALLIALAHAITPDGTPAPAALTVTGPIVSRPYLDMTLRLMERFGISFTEQEEGVFGLSPACAPAPESLAVSGDWSQAAVLLCVDALGGGVMLPNLRRDGLQGDARIVDVLEEMGPAHPSDARRVVRHQPVARRADARPHRLLRHSRSCAHSGADLHSGARPLHPDGCQPACA